ncbi:MAG: murein L,D-transpeptidase catalytic domain family protein, partial [Chitinophagales bacterium]
MQYPIRKTMLIACLAMAGIAFSTTAITAKNHLYSENLAATAPGAAVTPAPAPAPSADAMELYNDLHLASNGMNPEVFETALKGFAKLSNEGKITRQDKITIVDFSQPSDHKRLYVIDLNNKEILFQSLVSHGMGTGELWARSFSNNPSSYQSSPGFYITQETYNGNHGYSLRLDGLERGINDNARNRAIVMHGAPYANESSINALGYLGRSQGCPALPSSICKPVINTIKNGTCLFIYTPDHSY